MSNKRSAGSFCSLVVSTTAGTSDSVTTLPVAALGNGAECYCIANDSVYRYDSASTQVTTGDTFIAPLSGGGCWFKQDAGADYGTGIQGTALMTAAVGVTPVINTWTAIKTGANFYTPSSPSPSVLWNPNTSTGNFDYGAITGKRFLLLMTATMDDSATGVHSQIQWDLTQNGALVGTSSATQSAIGSTVSGVLGEPSEFVHCIILSATFGATYQYVFRVVNSAPGLCNLSRFQVAITAL